MKSLLAALIIVVGAAASLDAQHARLFDPRQLGELEGPDRVAWQRPDRIMDELGIADGSVVADLGAGGGWFTVRLAERVGPNGRVYAEDVQPEMLEAIRRRVQRLDFQNRVIPIFGTPIDPRLPARALDAALIVDSYQELEHPVPLLKNVAASLKANGRLGIVNFKKDGGGPGPPIEQRIDAERVIRDAESAGLRLHSRGDFLRYQYFLIFVPAS